MVASHGGETMWRCLAIACLAWIAAMHPAKSADFDGPRFLADVEKVVDRALGSRVGDFFFPGALVSDQLMDMIAGGSVPPSPPDIKHSFNDGGYLYSGCRIHSCLGEQGAIV